MTNNQDLREHKNFRERTSPFWAFFFSLLIHGFLIILFGATLAQWHSYQKKTPAFKKNPEVIFDLSPLPQERPIVDTPAAAPLEKAPDHSPFQSDKNTTASSELPPTGESPLPTQQGREQDTLSFQETERSLNKNIPHTSPPSSETRPQGLQADIKNALLSPPAVSTETTPSLAPNETAIAHLSVAAKNSEASTRASMLRGSISNKGPAAVNAEATRLGHYKKALTTAINSSWSYFIDHHLESLNIGTATVSFYITQEGKVELLHLTSNTSNPAFADHCLKLIMGTKLPPIPPDVAATLQGKRLEVEYRFTIYAD